MLKAKRNKLEKRVSTYIAPEYGEVSAPVASSAKAKNAKRLPYSTPEFQKRQRIPFVFGYF